MEHEKELHKIRENRADEKAVWDSDYAAIKNETDIKIS